MGRDFFITLPGKGGKNDGVTAPAPKKKRKKPTFAPPKCVEGGKMKRPFPILWGKKRDSCKISLRNWGGLGGGGGFCGGGGTSSLPEGRERMQCIREKGRGGKDRSYFIGIMGAEGKSIRKKG